MSVSIRLTIVAALALSSPAYADPPQLPFPFAVPFGTPKAPTPPPLTARPSWPWTMAPRQPAPTYGFPWTTQRRATANTPWPVVPGLPFSASPFAAGGPPNPFAATAFGNPLAGGSFMGMLSAPLMQGATSIVAPMAMNYAIASMNPTTFNNFLGLMMKPQPTGASFGVPFWGMGGNPAPRPYGFGYTPPSVPAGNPFLSPFAPRR